MSDANILRVLKKKNQLQDMAVIGKVRCAIEKPSIVSSLELSEGFFAIVDVYAVQCMGYDYFGEDTSYYDRNKIYFTVGSMLFSSVNPDIIGKWVRIQGRGNNGCTVKRQVYVKDPTEGVHCFCFKKGSKDGKSIWLIAPNTVKLLLKKDISNTILEDYVTFNGDEILEFTVPESTTNMMEYDGVKSYKEKENSAIKKSSGAYEYVENSEMVDVSKIDLKLVKHLEAPEISELLSVVQSEVDSQNMKRQDFAKKLSNRVDIGAKNMFEGGDPSEIAETIRNNYINVFAGNYNNPFCPTLNEQGKLYVDQLISSMYDVRFAGEENENEGKETNRKIMSEGLDKIKKGVALNPTVLGKEFGDYVKILKDDIKMAALIIGNVSGIGEDSIVQNYNTCFRYHNMSLGNWFFGLVFYPYIQGMMGKGLSVVDCDRLFFTLGRVYAYSYVGDDEFKNLMEENMKYRRYLMVLEGIKKEESSTACTLVSIPKMESNYFKFYPDRDKKYFHEVGLPMPLNKKLAMSYLLGTNLPAIDPTPYIGSNPCNRKLIAELEETGVIDTVNENFIAMTQNMYKEMVIYNTLIKKGRETTGITDEQVKTTIEEFEGKKGFSLESLQKDGIGLVKYKAAVLSGCAGSGKTTTSDCMSMCLEKYIEGDYEIVYGTPTGKACRRLAEVVGGNVKTIHSLFGVGVGSEPYLTPIRVRPNFSSKRIYIFDEMAMCSTDLMYEIVKNLSDADLVYFLGDIKQLPPIGRGVPFSMLMTILPCVELGVSKRAASGSLVNYNSLLINFVSDGRVVDLKGDESSFVIRDCADEMISVEVLKMFKELMNGKYGKEYLEDDIQVITQYQNPEKMWSAPVLNPPIQAFLRQGDKMLFRHVDRKFYKNDRVIHLKKNSYEMRRYEMVSPTVFKEVVTFGAVNGEVGKMVGVYQSDMVTIYPFDSKGFENKKDITPDEKKLLEKWREKEDSLRDDMSFSDKEFYFVVVQYYDNDLHRDVYVLYRAHCRPESTFGSFGEKVFEGGDLQNLDLAYALTAHKMQGSQGKAIIACFGKKSSPEFVNRNMINVIITRSQDFVGMVGSITGYDSAVTKGRLHVSPRVRDDILGVLAGEVEL